MRNKHLILCCREFQNSIKDSVYSLLVMLIEMYSMKSYTYTNDEIRNENGTRFIFKGLKKENIGSLKSISHITICWVEEAQYISRKSLDILVPTVRMDNSKIIYSLNPENKDDPVYEDYVIKERDDTVRLLINYTDNPFCTKKLIADAVYDKQNDIEKYNNVWLGQTKKISDAIIFAGRYVVEDFETPEDAVFYFGADFGDTDPNTLIRCFVVNDVLFIDYEMAERKQDIDKIPDGYNQVPESRNYKIRGDAARPDTIRYIRNRGFNIVKCDKLKIEDGIAFIKSFRRVVIHSRCKETIYEFGSYSRKIDRMTGEVLQQIVDKDNHIIDALRYALEPLLLQKRVRKKRSYSVNI